MKVIGAIAVFSMFCLVAIVVLILLGGVIRRQEDGARLVGEIRTFVEKKHGKCFEATETWGGKRWDRRATTPIACPPRDDGPDLYMMPNGNGTLMPMFF